MTFPLLSNRTNFIYDLIFTRNCLFARDGSVPFAGRGNNTRASVVRSDEGKMLPISGTAVNENIALNIHSGGILNENESVLDASKHEELVQIYAEEDLDTDDEVNHLNLQLGYA